MAVKNTHKLKDHFNNNEVVSISSRLTTKCNSEDKAVVFLSEYELVANGLSFVAFYVGKAILKTPDSDGFIYKKKREWFVYGGSGNLIHNSQSGSVDSQCLTLKSIKLINRTFDLVEMTSDVDGAIYTNSIACIIESDYIKNITKDKSILCLNTGSFNYKDVEKIIHCSKSKILGIDSTFPEELKKYSSVKYVCEESQKNNLDCLND